MERFMVLSPIMVANMEVDMVKVLMENFNMKILVQEEELSNPI